MTRVADGTVETSNSELQTWMDCKRRWWLQYYRQLRPAAEKPDGPLAIGSRVHGSLESGYSTPGREAAARALLAQSIEDDYPKAAALGDDVLKKFESEAELCLIMLEGFYEWAAEEGLDAEWEVVSHEQILKAPPILVHGESVVLKGKLDQIVRRMMDGALFMRDWKTTQEKSPLMMAFRPQLRMYLLLLALTEYDAQVSGGQFVFLRKVKRTARAVPPFYFVEPVYVAPREMESFWVEVNGTLSNMVQDVHRLDAGEDHRAVVPPRPTRDCSWRCPFVGCCEMFDDGSRVEDYLAANFRQGDPYEYYGLETDNHDTEGTALTIR